MVDALPINRCMQPGSFAQSGLYSNLHADLLLLPGYPGVPWLPAGCRIGYGQPVLTYVIKCSAIKKNGKTYDTRGRAQHLLDRCAPAVWYQFAFCNTNF